MPQKNEEFSYDLVTHILHILALPLDLHVYEVGFESNSFDAEEVAQEFMKKIDKAKTPLGQAEGMTS